MSRQGLQFDEEGRLRHFITLDGLDRGTLTEILDSAENFATVGARQVKKVPLLRGKTIANLFFEPSTRTRTTFELAAKRLSADVLNLNISTSSASKGESLLDMLRNLEAMNCDMFVVRHNTSGAAHFIAEHVAPHISVINAGDGWHAHPTQAMLDMFTIRRHKGDFTALRVAIVGDIKHSRVARSEIQALSILGVPEIRVIAPQTLLPPEAERMGVHVYHQPRSGNRLGRGRRPALGDPRAGQQRPGGAHGHHAPERGGGLMRIRIHGGRVIDPASGHDAVTDLYIGDGKILSLDKAPDGFTPDREIDAHGLHVIPGLVDVSARLREPGQEHKGTIASETRAAAAGGITTLCLPPDTDPIIETPAVAELIARRARVSPTPADR